MAMDDYAGRVVLVTGASTGLGRAIAVEIVLYPLYLVTGGRLSDQHHATLATLGADARARALRRPVLHLREGRGRRSRASVCGARAP